MTSAQATPSARQTELLEAAYRYALEHGLAELSLRPLATAIGSSPRVLLYLFGSKDGLVRALLNRARIEEVALLGRLEPGSGLERAALQLWGWMSAPEHRPLVTLWVEGYGRSLIDPDGPWAGFAEAGVRETTARRSTHPAAAARATYRISAVAAKAFGESTAGPKCWDSCRIAISPTKPQTSRGPRAVSVVGAGVEPGAEGEDDQLERQGDRGVLPQTEPDLGGVVVGQRQVGRVHQQVEQPVREARERDEQETPRPAGCSEGHRDDGGERHGHQRSADQAVGERHVVEVEVVRLGEPFGEAHLLHIGQHQRHEAEVEPLHRHEPHPQRQRHTCAAGGEGSGVVTDEHECNLAVTGPTRFGP